MAPQTKELILKFAKEIALEISVVLGRKLVAIPEIIKTAQQQEQLETTNENNKQ